MTAVLSFDSIYMIVVLTRHDVDVELFLGIFSLSKNFDCVVDVLETTYYSNPLSDMPGTRVGFVSLIITICLQNIAN